MLPEIHDEDTKSPLLNKNIRSEPKKSSFEEFYETFDELLDDDERPQDDKEYKEMVGLYEETFKNIVEGDVVRGTIVGIEGDEVVIDVGYKSEGRISIEEFRKNGEFHELEIGKQIEVYLEEKEDADGQIILSKEKADRIRVWDDINYAYDRQEAIDGKVIERIKGGFTVDVGVRAFLPGSQVDLRPIKNLDDIVGRTFKMKIIKLNRKRGNIILSRRILLEEEREELKSDTLSHLKETAIITGTVKNITDYGAFIDLGGIDGLLHITDMSWGRVNHPSELFMVGDQVEVMVLKFDRDSEKVSLGLKQKTPDPWDNVEEKYAISSVVKGKVISLTDYGAFVELEEGVEGLVHVSEMSWTRRVRHPSKIVAIGDIIEAVVLDQNRDQKRISLGMKQVEPNPWTVLEERYPVGSVVEGRVRNLTDFGAFIELEEGIDGLVHISDLSWTKRIKHPSEILKKGEKVEVKIMKIDAENERLSLGLRQVNPDPWSQIEEKYPINSNINVKIVRFTDFGCFAELEDGIEGLIHISELDRKRVQKPDDVVNIGEEVTVKIIKIETEERKIGLSLKAYREEIGFYDALAQRTKGKTRGKRYSKVSSTKDNDDILAKEMAASMEEAIKETSSKRMDKRKSQDKVSSQDESSADLEAQYENENIEDVEDLSENDLIASDPEADEDSIVNPEKFEDPINSELDPENKKEQDLSLDDQRPTVQPPEIK